MARTSTTDAPTPTAFFDRLSSGLLRLPDRSGPSAPRGIGPWQIGARLGRGGMSTVYAALRETPLGPQTAALKLAKRSGTAVCEAFASEARLLQQFGPRTVAAWIDGGIHTDGRPYLVMETLPGQVLTAHTKRLPLWERLLLLWRTCRQVAVLHEADVLHGDLKPDHLIVRPDGDVTLLDLGLARSLRQAAAAPRLGITPEFAAPEQILGGPVGLRADVYALGLVLYEALTGTRKIPWMLAGDPTLLPDATETSETLPPPVQDVLARALDVDPNARYPTAGALADALGDILDTFSSVTCDPVKALHLSGSVY